VLDSSGLSIVGAGEWAAEKHGGRGRRGWKKLHLGVAPTSEILAHALTEATTDDATTGLDLIDVVDGDLVSIIADAAYDTVAIYETAGARGATVVVLPPGQRTYLAGDQRHPPGWRILSGHDIAFRKPEYHCWMSGGRT